MLTMATENSKECIITGDVNVNFLTRRNNDFRRTLTLFGFKQLITKPTRPNDKDATLIDVVISNYPINIPATEVIPLSFSDHEMIGFTRKINNLKYQPRTINCRDYKHYKTKSETKSVNKAY